MESFSGSCGSFVFAVDFGGTARFVRSGLNRRCVELFLFPVDSRPIGSSRSSSRRAGKANHVNRLAVALADDLRGVGGRGAHLDGTFPCNGGFVRRVLLDVTLYLGSEKQ